MGRPTDLNKSEVEEIRKKSSVEKEDIPWDYSEGKVKINANLGVNDIWFLNIRLQV